MDNTIIFQLSVLQKLSDDQLKAAISFFLKCDKSEVNKLSESQLKSGIFVLHFANPANDYSLILHQNNSKKLYVIDLHIVTEKPATNIDLAFIRVIETEVTEYLIKEGVFDQIKNLFAPIRRGYSLWPYFVTTDERLLEAAHVETVFEKQSEFQHIRISKDKMSGNVLYLDDDVMFGEGDQEPYTRVLLGLETGKPRRHDYQDKEVLILGGGDGGVIAELLKHSPKMVEMVEIDEEVVKACRVHMRGACGDAMDSFEGPNKRIIIGDCLEHLHQAVQSGKQYDFIINDLTEFPVNKEKRGWSYNFATENSQVMELSLLALKQSGRYLSRGAGLSGEEYWKVYEEDAVRLGCQFQVYNSFVPSFYEVYRLYELWRNNA